MIFVVWWVFDDERRRKGQKSDLLVLKPLKRRSGRLDQNARVHANLQTLVRNAVDAIRKGMLIEKNGKKEKRNQESSILTSS